MVRLLYRFCLVALVTGMGLVGAYGCRRGSPDPPRQAILIILDAARPDRFSCYGYARATTPEMDRLASRGVLFRRHFAQDTSTRPSVSSLMYSRFFCIPLFPGNPQVLYSRPAALFRRPDDAQISFVKALELDGFKTGAISAHEWTGDRTAFAAEFTEMHDLATRLGTRERPLPSAGTVIDYAISWIRENKDRDYFLYIHLMDPHYPHYFEADAQEFFGASWYDAHNFTPDGGPIVPDSALSETDRRYANALYDGSMRYTDRHVGRLAEFLTQEDLIGHTVVTISADHGENLFDAPGGRTREGAAIFTHGGPWLDPLAWVPLIIHYPRKLEPSEFQNLSEGVDVGPTILSLLDVPVPAGKAFDGTDLVQVISGKAPPKSHVLKPGAIRTDKYKCFFEPPDEVLFGEPAPDASTLSGQLYDLASDPGETANLFQSEPEVVAALLQRYRTSLATHYRRYESARSSAQPSSAFAISAKHMLTDVQLPQATRERLADGWSRVKLGSQFVITASNPNEPLSVHFPLPNGAYKLAVNMQGHVILEIGNQHRELNAKGVAEFGVVNVTDEVFRATIRPQSNQRVAIAFFGFIPPAAVTQDRAEIEEQTERLRALGYVD
ncbi:MAG: sulfatase [Phycisphaerales bacterium]|nr:MAG: sulfatase [Phycisphaerales bacterium]